LQEHGKILLSVRDNGIGFDTKYADKVFEVFYRLHKEDEYPGSGVGLGIVKRIINRCGGEIWAEGKVNEGAAFYFTLPDSASENNHYET
jgi:light-regulated signal transduction histidine kinase (bacteriophytochrome)